MVVSAVDDKPKTTRRLQRLENIRRDPRVTLLVDEYDEDWSNLWWVRADGQARVVESGSELAAPVAWLCDKYEQYRDTPPRGARGLGRPRDGDRMGGGQVISMNPAMCPREDPASSGHEVRARAREPLGKFQQPSSADSSSAPAVSARSTGP